jgi:cell division protein FtsW
MRPDAALSNESQLTDWWVSLDRVLLASMLLLAGIGLIIVLAATTAVTARRGLPPFQLFQKHLFAVALALTAAVALSTLKERHIRRIALLLSISALVGLVAVLLIGPEVNGARRWLRLGGLSIQPSELMKPAFVVLSAFLLSEARMRREWPWLMPLAAAFFLLTIGLIVLEPDVGQTLLISAVWIGMLVLAGVSVKILAGLAALGLGGFAIAATVFDHVNRRLMAFLFTGNEGQQALRARQSFVEGGLYGRGPGEGSIKNVLPDAHTDYIFAVAAEEYGAITCLVILAIFALITVRLFDRAFATSDLFARLSLGGLALLLGGQGLIHMGVNVGLLPAKGMTLPLISAGGSSTLGTGLAFGFALALGRQEAKRPRRRPPTPA